MGASRKPGIAFWIVSSLALFWYLMGVLKYFLRLYESESTIGHLSPERLTLFNETPFWSTLAFAIAVMAGAIGSACLLSLKKIALPFFILSFLGIVIHGIDIILRFKISEFETLEIIMKFIIFVFGMFFIRYTKSCVLKGWLK